MLVKELDEDGGGWQAMVSKYFSIIEKYLSV